MAREQSYNTAYEDTGYVDPLEQAIRDYIATGPSPAELAAAMAQYGVSAEQIAQATDYTVEQVNTYVATPEPTPTPEPAPVAQPVVPEAVEAAPVAPPVQPPPPTPVVESAPVVPERVQYGAPPTTQATTAATTTTTVTPPTVAQVTAAIDKWTTDNPGATPQQLAIAIKDGMGLTPEVTQALATKYNMSTADITTNFNTLVAQPVTPPTTTTAPPTVAQVRTAIDSWTTANPGATPEQLATAIKGGMGMTDTVAQALAEKYNSTPAAMVESYNKALDPYAGVQVTDYQGKTYDAKTLIALATQVAQNLDTTKSSGGVFGTKNENIGFDYSTLSSAYGGKTFTSGDQVAFDMARSLLNQGITNYDQVKTLQKTTIDVAGGYNEDGTPVTYQREVLINPATGQEVNTQFGYTATGKGGTEYYLDPTTGKVFTQGISSSDVSPAMMTALSIGASFLMPGVGAVLAAELGISVAAGTALANAGLQLAMGADAKTVLLNAGLNMSGVTGSIDKTVFSTISDFAGDSFAGLSGETLQKAIGTAATAVTRAGTTFLTTGDTTTALNAAAGSVVNDVISGRTGSTALGAGAAAYVQTGSLSTAALVATNAAAYNAGVTNQQSVVDLFNGAKNSLLQTTVATDLTANGITQTDLDNLFDPSKNTYLSSSETYGTGTQIAGATDGTGNISPFVADQMKPGIGEEIVGDRRGTDGNTYVREIKGTDDEGNEYSYKVVYDPISKAYTYETVSGAAVSGLITPGSDNTITVTSSKTRPDFSKPIDVLNTGTGSNKTLGPVKPTDFTLGSNISVPAGNVAGTTNTTSLPGNISVPGGNVAGVGNASVGGNVITVGTGGNANVSVIGGTGGNGNANIGGTGGNGNITVGNTTTGNGNITVGGTGGNGNANVGNVGGNIVVGNTTGNANVSVGGNIVVGNTTGNANVSTTGNVSTVGNTVGNVSTVGNVITVINTPNTTPNVSTPITTTLGSSITPLKFASGGLNPGYIAPTPFYPTTNDAQSKFYYGSRPYQTGGPTGQVFDPVLYNTAPEAPRVPFGSQAVNQPLTSAEIAAIVANPGSNNSQQRTQQASTVAAPVAPPPAPINVQQPVSQPAPVAPVYEPPAPVYQAPVYQAPPAPVQQPLARDPELAGMPDWMYESMMQNQQRQAEQIARDGYAIDTMDIKPWTQWMMDQRNPPAYQPAPAPTPIAPEFLAPPVTQLAPKTQEQINAEVGEWRRSMGMPDLPPEPDPSQYQADILPIARVDQPIAPQQPADPRDAFQMPAGFRYAGGDDMDAGTAIYNPVLNGYLAPITNTLGPVAP